MCPNETKYMINRRNDVEDGKLKSANTQIQFFLMRRAHVEWRVEVSRDMYYNK